MGGTSKSLAAETNFIGAKEDPNKYLCPIYESPRKRKKPIVYASATNAPPTLLSKPSNLMNYSNVHYDLGPVVSPEEISRTYSQTIVDLPTLSIPP